jgi:hypothetical protein
VHGFTGKASKRSTRSRQSPHRQFKGGQRAAVLRAWTAQRLHSGKWIPRPTLAEAAIMCGSSMPYIAAVDLLVQHGDLRLFDRVLSGKIPLLMAAGLLRKRTRLVKSFRRASVKDRIDAARVIGPGQIFDEMLVPAL